MKAYKYILFYIFGSFVIVFLLTAISRQVLGQGQSLSIYPPVIEIQTTPPSSPTVPIILQNNNSEDVELSIQLIPLKQDGANGSILLMPSLAEKGFYPYYRNKIQFLIEGKKTEQIKLEALETREINLNITLDKGDPPGDYYYSIIFISDGSEPKESSVAKIPTGIATNLLLSIGPKDLSSGGISEFIAPKFKSQGPVDFILKVHNASKHLIEPQGEINISNIFGNKIGQVTILPQYVLAGSDRYLIGTNQATSDAQLANTYTTSPKVRWNEKFLLGLYEAKAEIILEENGKKIEAKTYFFAFPTYLFFAISITVFIAISIYLRVKKKI